MRGNASPVYVCLFAEFGEPVCLDCSASRLTADHDIFDGFAVFQCVDFPENRSFLKLEFGAKGLVGDRNDERAFVFDAHRMAAAAEFRAEDRLPVFHERTFGTWLL